MPKNVTIRDIAAEAGVSIALVSFVMNNTTDENGRRKYRVSEQSRERILAAAKRLNYQPNYAARTLRNGKTRFIGVVLSDISNYFYGEIARIVEEHIASKGYTMLLGNSNENPEKFDKIIRTFIDRGAEGLIVVPCEGSLPTLDYISNCHIPVVVLDREDAPIRAPKVVLDNRKAMRTATDLLVSKGCRRIEMITYNMAITTFRERERGYMDGISEAGLGPDVAKVHRVPFNDVEGGTLRLVPEILESDVDGLVFATNTLCIYTIKALRSMSCEPGSRIKVVGFDNSQAYDLLSPPVPHVQQPIEEISAKCSELIFDLINKRIPQEDYICTLEGKLANAY
ncbi:MAG: LacI family DNA-binding transcriptional regulator [Bacteroidales bacterium]|nr:LacI family DNA-binding transcriptional regulator [Bacteroidales bacterium]